MAYDITIIGAGPGGYVAAIRGAQLGASIALIEKSELGGTCLNKGCIPTKAMLASVHCLDNIKHAKSFGIEVGEFCANIESVNARQKKIVHQMGKGLEQLLKSYSAITIYRGEASIASSQKVVVLGDENIEIETNNIIIASGSICASLGNIKVDHELIINSDDALNLTEYPEKIVIIGAGAIGIEWARIFSAFGVDVTIVEMLDRIAPACDSDISNVALKMFKRYNVKVITGVKVDEVQKTSDFINIKLSNGEAITADKVLLGVGRSPNSDIKGLNKLGVKLKGRFIEANSYMQTSVSNIYAIGDVVGNLQLAHVASHEGVLAVEHLMGQKVNPIDYTTVPFVIYGSPEMAGVGLNEDQAKEKGFDYEVNTFYYAANGRAVAEGESIGMVKTLIDADTHKIMGVHIVGHGASDLLHQGVIAVKNSLTKEHFKETIYAHPTLSEAFYESIVNLHVSDKQKMLKSRR